MKQKVWRRKEIIVRQEVEDETDPERVYEQQKSAHGIEERYWSYGREYYGDGCWTKDPTKCEYKQRIYYLDGDVLYSRDMSGADVRKLAEVKGKDRLKDRLARMLLKDVCYSDKVFVNDSGIYVCKLLSDSILYIWRIDFDGQIVAMYREMVAVPGEEYSKYVFNTVYIYENTAYFVNYLHGCCLKSLQMGAKKSTVIYDRAAFIRNVYALDNKVVFYAEYENAEFEGMDDEGWMLLDFEEGSIESLTNPYCNPENIVDNLTVYHEESNNYNVNCDYYREIKFFDFRRGIFWIERTKKAGNRKSETHYYEPRYLCGNRGEIVSDMPVWKLPDWSSFSSEHNDIYFDSEHYYVLLRGLLLVSVGRDGSVYQWNTDPRNYGFFSFRVFGKTLFLVLDENGEKQYSLDFIPGK